MTAAWFASSLLLAVLGLFPALTQAAAYKCVSPGGRVTFSDQPCAEHEQGAEIQLPQPARLGSAFGGDPPPAAEGADADGKPQGSTGPQRGARPRPGTAEPSGMLQPGQPTAPPAPPPPPPPQDDPRTAQVERLGALLSELQATLEVAGGDCTASTKALDGWIGRNAGPVQQLNGVWKTVLEESEPDAKLAASRTATQEQLRAVRSQSLSQLTARCWQDPDLVDAVDRTRAALPD
ncbi:MAG TPA: DUF4124 domain-containing protein [Gammaproteobacteria bacterium]